MAWMIFSLEEVPKNLLSYFFKQWTEASCYILKRRSMLTKIVQTRMRHSLMPMETVIRTSILSLADIIIIRRMIPYCKTDFILMMEMPTLLEKSMHCRKYRSVAVVPQNVILMVMVFKICLLADG